MPFGSIKRNTADKWFSDCVRLRAKYRCERCETDYSDRNRQGLQCSHFIGRGISWAVRYDPLNAMSLCAKCHIDVTAHPVAHVNLWRDIHGSIYGADRSDAQLNALLQRSICPEREQYARKHHKEIAKHYRLTFKEQLEYFEATEGFEDRYGFTSCRYR